MAERVELCFGGFGGQGIVLMGTLLGSAAVKEGLWAAGSNSYGAQARGSACKAEVVLSSKPVDFPRVVEADLLVALSQEACERFSPLLTVGGILIHDVPGVVPPPGVDAVQVPIQGTKVALEKLGSTQPVNMVFLGALAGMTALVSLAALVQAMEEIVSAGFVELNRRALEEGFSMGVTARESIPAKFTDRFLIPRAR